MPTGAILIEPRYNGPAGSGNGGYTCGLVAAALDAPTPEVTLRAPPPLARPLRLERDDGGVRLLDGQALVADARRGRLEGPVPELVSVADAERAAARYAGFERHEFPTCFVCGPEREPGDGLRIFAGPVDGQDVVAAPWRPGEVRPELVWAALDCPGAFAVGFAERGATLLGRMAATIHALPTTGDDYVVVAWPRGEDGRKLYAGTALFASDGSLLAEARQTWIVPR
jgi:hypothetical protein